MTYNTDIDFPRSITRNPPDYVSECLSEMNIANLDMIKKSGKRSDPNSPPIISVIKNEFDRLEDFLRHYRHYGIEKFLFIDNGSSDGSLEFLADQPDVDLFQTKRPFVWQKKQGWINLAISILGRNKNSWFIYVDADEHLVFDEMEKWSFTDLSQKMNEFGINRVRGMLVDMYTRDSLLKSNYSHGQRLIESYPYFDTVGYKEEKYIQIISRKGGPRQRVFGDIDGSFRPEMTKYPMFKLDGHDIFANPHHIWPYEDNFQSPCYIGIIHFKFLPGIIKKIDTAINDNSYWGNSIEYRRYKDVLKENPKISLHGEISARYESSNDLLRFGIIEDIDWNV